MEPDNQDVDHSLTEEKACRDKQDTLSETHEPLQQQVLIRKAREFRLAGFGYGSNKVPTLSPKAKKTDRQTVRYVIVKLKQVQWYKWVK